MTDNSDLLQIARDAVALGADMVKNTRPRHIREKSDRDIVTDVDVEVERAVREQLSKKTPGIGFLGEEEGTDDPDTEYLWTLDPIDGTSNFAHGLPLCATQLALLHHKRPILAVITAPFLDLQYYATKGTGAFCNGIQINTSKTIELSKAIVSLGDYATGKRSRSKNRFRIELTARLAERVERVRMFGTAALDLAWVADGHTDATFIMANKPWDTFAGALIAREAGAIVVDKFGSPHDIRARETLAFTSILEVPITELMNEINGDFKSEDQPFSHTDRQPT